MGFHFQLNAPAIANTKFLRNYSDQDPHQLRYYSFDCIPSISFADSYYLDCSCCIGCHSLL